MKATCPTCSSSYRVADEKVPEVGAQIRCPKCGTLFVVRKDAAPTIPPPAVAPLPQPAEKHSQATPMRDLLGTAMTPPAGVKAAPSPPAGVPLRPNPLKQVLSQPFPAQATPIQPAPRPPKPVAPVQAPIRPAPKPATPPSPEPPGRFSIDDSVTPYLAGLSGEAQVTGRPPPDNDPLDTDPAWKDKGVSVIRAQSKVKGAGIVEPYRVRTARGTTYDFSTREALLRWLGERDDLTGCEVAEPDGGWVDAKVFIGAKAPPPAAGISAAAAAAAVALQREGMLAPPGPRAGIALWVAFGASLLLLLLTAGATATRFGIVDLSGVLPLSALGIQFPRQPALPVLVEPKVEEIATPDPEAVFKKALADAKQAMRSKQFSKAALEFNRALGIHPDSAEALEGLAKAYNGLGDRERALAMLKRPRDTQDGGLPPKEPKTN